IDKAMIKKALVPPLSVQTLVENAVNHGVLKRAAGGTVTIRIVEENDHLQVSVTDNGVGISVSKMDVLLTPKQDNTEGIGLFNTEQRLRNLYGKGLVIESVVDEGTCVSFTIPLKRA